MVNWEAVGALAEGLGAVVVVISVLYLALQVRQANLQAQATAHTDWLTTWNDTTVKGLTRDRDTVQVMQRGFADFDGMPQVDKAIFAHQIAAAINHWYLADILASRGLIEDELYKAATEVVLSLCSTRGGRQYLEASAAAFPKGAEVLRMLQSGEGSLPPWDELQPWWAADGRTDSNQQGEL